MFDSFAKTLLKDSTIKAKSEYIPGEYATIHHTDKCTISAITYKLSTHFRDFKDSSNIELIVLKDNTVYACAPMHKTIEMKTTDDEYKDCLGLKDLVSVVAKKKALSR